MFGEHWCVRDKHFSIIKLLVNNDNGVQGWAMKRRVRSRAHHTALPVQISDPLSVRGQGNAAVVQHVRVTPARLLNLSPHKVMVYGYFSALN